FRLRVRKATFLSLQDMNVAFLTECTSTRRQRRAYGGGVGVDAFESHRGVLYGVAYRMLGTRVDAEDVLQEAWIRWNRVDAADVENPRAYLVRLVTNESIDHLRRVKAR